MSEIYSELYLFKDYSSVSGVSKYICNPLIVEKDYICEYCGTPTYFKKHLCKFKLEKARYYCEICGRVTVREEEACKAKLIGC
jgi:hypothetical protein